MERATRVVILSAPSGAGKTTVLKRLLLALPQLQFSVSATTRARRPHEVEAQDYYFLSPEAFDEKLAAGAFVEWEEVYPGLRYGTLQAELDRITHAGGVPIFEVDVNGGLKLKQIFGERAMAIFLAPPSQAALRQRLEARGTETPQEIERRLQKASRELAQQPCFDVVVVNDDLAQTVAQLTEVVQGFLWPAQAPR